jgi:hypothetical protein
LLRNAHADNFSKEKAEMRGTFSLTSLDWRAIVFRVIAAACALLLLTFGGLISILVPWGDPGLPFPGFTPELHRWHSALLGVTEAILLPGLLFVLIWRPRQRPLLMQFFVVVGVALVVPHFLTRGKTPISSAFIVFPIIAYPALGALLRFPSDAGTTVLLLVLALLAASVLGVDAFHNLQLQLAHAGGEHAHQGHWATAFSLDLVLAFALLIAARRIPGAHALGLLASVSLVYLGAAAAALPGQAGSWGFSGGMLALFGGAALAASHLWATRGEANQAQSQFSDSPSGNS